MYVFVLFALCEHCERIQIECDELFFAHNYINY